MKKKYPSTSNTLGKVLSLCGYFDAKLLNEAKAIFERNNNKADMAIVLYNLGEKNQYQSSIGKKTLCLNGCSLFFLQIIIIMIILFCKAQCKYKTVHLIISHCTVQSQIIT